MEEKFLYEMHLHTKEGSACSGSSGAEYPVLYQEAGYTGIVVTDHFFNGNCAADRSLPWEARVHEYCKGYEVAKNAGEKIGFDVFFGVEFNFQGDEYLVYGVDKAWLVKNPEIMEMDRKTFFDFVRASGGCVAQAHPYRVRDYIKKIRLHHDIVDAIEVYNAGNGIEENAQALELAIRSKLPMLSGSDIHFASIDAVQNSVGTVFEEKLTCEKDIVDAILGNKVRISAKEMGKLNSFLEKK